MFEQPLIHPKPETLGSLVADTSIVAGAVALGLRFSYTGTQLLVGSNRSPPERDQPHDR